MPTKELAVKETIFEKLRWFVDPIPDWIFKDPERMHMVLQTAVDFHVREIDLQIQTLNLEKERLQKMLKVTQR